MSMFPRPRSIVMLVVVAMAAILAAAHPASLAAQAGARDRTIFVSAMTDKGEPVEGLDADAFVIREDGVRREVLRVSRATEPIDIALLVDNSAAAMSAIPFMREALTAFATAMTPANRIALITLADRPTISTNYTSDAAILRDRISRLFALSQSGATLLDALDETARGLMRREPGRAAIVPVITDGQEFTNLYARDVARTLRATGAAMHAVTIGQFLHSNEQGTRERTFILDEGPRTTGGQVIDLLSPMGLDQAMQRLARELSSQYKVIYNRPESLIPPERVDVSSARPDVMMRGTTPRDEGARR